MCAIFGIFGEPEAAMKAYMGIWTMQHRGQESHGVAVSDSKVIRGETALGLVSDSVDDRLVATLPGTIAVAHTRYGTAGEHAALKNAQPILTDSQHGQMAIAHNGNLTNANQLRSDLRRQGCMFCSDSDTEIFSHLCARSAHSTPEDALTEAMRRVEGSYSLVVMTKDALIGARDPHGFRPLVIGRLANNAIVLCSETVALDLLGGKVVREVNPGEIVVIRDQYGAKPIEACPPAEQLQQCIFEHVYFSRPDGHTFGESVNDVRTSLGRLLAQERPAVADVVVPVPDSGLCAALGYSEESKIPLKMGLIRNHYVGRVFIHASASQRSQRIRIKLNPVGSILDGQRVVLVDDSIVRGDTSREIVRMVKEAGATEVHFRVSCPPTKGPCYYGIDTPDKTRLIAWRNSLTEIKAYLEADSVGYLSLEAMLSAVRPDRKNCYCTSCYTGVYPTGLVPLQKE